MKKKTTILLPLLLSLALASNGGGASGQQTPSADTDPSFLEMLRNGGLIPDPGFVLAVVGKTFGEYGLFDASLTIGVLLYLFLTLYRIAAATVSLRPQIVYGGIIRGAVVGAILTAYGPITDFTMGMWTEAYKAGIHIGGKLIDAAVSDNFVVDGLGLITGGAAAGMAGAGTKLLKEAGEAVAQKGVRVLETNVRKEGMERVATTAGTEALKGAARVLDYMNIIGIMMIPLFLSIVAMTILSGFLLLLANLVFPPLVATLMASPQTGASFAGRWAQAFVGAFSTAFLAPIIYGGAAIIAIKAPAEATALRIQKALDLITGPAAWYEKIVNILVGVGQLLWALVALAVILGISIWVGWLLVQSVGRYVAQLTTGTFGGGGLAETLAAAFAFRQAGEIAANSPALQNLSSAGKNFGEAGLRTGWELTKHAGQPVAGGVLWAGKGLSEIAKYGFQRARSLRTGEQVPPIGSYLKENVGPMGKYIPRRTTSQFSATDYAIRRMYYGMDPDTAYEGIRMPTPEEKERYLAQEIAGTATKEGGTTETGKDQIKANPATIRPIEKIEGVNFSWRPPFINVKVKRGEINLPEGNREPRPTVSLTGLNRIEEDALRNHNNNNNGGDGGGGGGGASTPPPPPPPGTSLSESHSSSSANNATVHNDTEKTIQDLIPGKGTAEDVKKTPEPEKET